MPAKRTATALFAALHCLCGALPADTVTLKSGEKLAGKILSETETEVTMSVQISATIKDERVVKREEIAAIDKVQPDELAWAAMANFVPGTESLEREEYDRIRTALGYFTSTFPKSPHAALAQSRLDQFTTEQVRVSVGEVKLNGQWLPKDRVLEERVQIGGRVLLNRMKRAVAAGQFAEAMATLDQMEKSFPGSLSYPEAVELARRVLPALSAAVEQRKEALTRQTDDEKVRLKASKGAEHAQLEALLKQEKTRTEATLAASERAGVKWLPLQPANEKSLASLLSKVGSEMTRLNGLKLEKMEDSARLSQEGAAAFAAGNFDAAERLLKDATSAWAENELAKRTQVKLTEAKKAAIAPRTPPPAPAAPPKRGPSASSHAAATPAPALASQAESAPPEEPKSLLKKPAFFIGVAAVVAFGAVIGKKIAQTRASAANVLDR